MENSTLVVCHFVGRQLSIWLKSCPSYLAAIPPPKNQFKAQELEAENVVRKFDPGLVMSTGWSQSPNRVLANDTFACSSLL
jgi:hypothetical protein